MVGGLIWIVMRRTATLNFQAQSSRCHFWNDEEGETWKRWYHVEVQKDFSKPDILSVVKVQSYPKWRRSIRRRKLRWIDGVESDLRTLGKRNRQSVTQSRPKFSNRLRLISCCSARKLMWNKMVIHIKLQW